MRLRRRPPRPPGAPDVPGYELLAPAGFGASGAVWSARDPGGRGVVVAVVPLARGAGGAAQLRRLGRLRGGHHPHLAQVLDVVAVGQDRCAIVSEVVVGPSLATVRAARGALSVPEVATLLAGLGSALGYLHARGVVHADVSPTNVLVAPGGVPVLVDLAGEGVRERGTAGFVPPERAGGSAPGAPGDVWALARMLRWASDGDVEVARLVAPALAADPRQRPLARDLAALAPVLADAEGVAVPDTGTLAQAQLRADAIHVPTQLARARRPRPSHRRGRPVVQAAAILGSLAVGLGAAAWATGTGRDGTGAGTAAGAPEVTAAVRALVIARDEALTAGDRARLSSLTVPGSAAARADARLLDGLATAGTVVDGLTTAVGAITVVPGPAPGRVVVDVRTRQGTYMLTTDGVPSTVPPQPWRCTRLVLAGPPPWRVTEALPCGRS